MKQIELGAALRGSGPRLAGGLAGALLLCASCGGGGGGGSSSSNLPTGTVRINPITGTNFVVTANQGGGASGLAIRRAFWGRMVDVYDRVLTTGERRLQFEDFVIGDNIVSNGVEFLLERDPLTEKENLIILHEFGSSGYQSAFGKLGANTAPLTDKSLTGLPPFTAVARNAVLVFEFDDLIDAQTINKDTIEVLAGYPPILPFEARVVPDLTHGDLVDLDGDGVAEFYTTGVYVDFTVSVLEAQNSNPPLPVNALGLPEAQVVDQPNVLIRIPTRVDASSGQFGVLANPSGGSVFFAGNGSSDPQSPTEDVLRAFRSGGAAAGDESNGFLPDDVPPEVIGIQAVDIGNVRSEGGEFFSIDFDFELPACGSTPDVGDVVETSSHLAQVIESSAPPGANGEVRDLQVLLISGSQDTFLAFRGLASFTTPFDPNDGAPPSCFVRYTVEPSMPPAQGVHPTTAMRIRFSEPMDPASVQALDTFRIERTTPGVSVFELPIVGHIDPSVDLRDFTFRPAVALSHVQGQGEEYIVNLVGGVNGVIDLAGNALVNDLADLAGELPRFELDPLQPTVQSNGVAFRYTGQDEDGDGAPEIRGQFLLDLERGSIKPRPVTRFSGVADNTQPVVGAMIPFTMAIQTPLSNFGSRMMSTWRYHDLGFGLTDESKINVDVEFLAWSPFSAVQQDFFPEFRMALAHSFFLPDEGVTTGLLPMYPQSGLVKEFDGNLLSSTEDPLDVVHPKGSGGYIISPMQRFPASTGTEMVYWPMNRNVQTGDALPAADRRTYTWRDTAVLAVGGPNGEGVDTLRFRQVVGGGVMGVYPAGAVPTVGLPLLMEFRCYDNDDSLGFNGFATNLALNSSVRPNFRAFSTGGPLPDGSGSVFIDPDNEPVARGGVTTLPGREVDNTFYVGQADFVVRVSRVHSIWFTASSANTQFAAPVIEPSADLQPLGTEVTLAVRGASALTPSMGQELDARTYDFYGDPVGPPMPAGWSVTFLNNDPTWKASASAIDGAQFFQYRVSLVSNTDSTRIPELAGLGIAYLY